MKNEKIDKINYFVLLHAILFLYSLTAVCSKYASKLPFLSLKWCALYALMIFILGVYAILWQQILKKLPLTLAFANKAITIIWGMLFGALIFSEKITVFNIIGGAIVLFGVILMVTDKKTDETVTLVVEISMGNEKGGDNE